MFFKVYDDLVPDWLQDHFELLTLGRAGDKVMHPSVEFRCKYEDTAQDADGRAPLSFYHVLKSSAANSPHFDSFFEIPRLFCQAESLALQELLAARIYLILPYRTELRHYAPHIDFPFPHTVLLYYLNDADGCTVFFNKQREVVEEIAPRKGRLLVFDGTVYHGGGIPHRGPRCVVNYNVLVQPRNARADPIAS
jgi:hypothetical protein